MFIYNDEKELNKIINKNYMYMCYILRETKLDVKTTIQFDFGFEGTNTSGTIKKN